MVHRSDFTSPNGPFGGPTTKPVKARRVKFLFAWYDLWVGVFWDRKSRKLYILPLPCIGVVVQL